MVKVTYRITAITLIAFLIYYVLKEFGFGPFYRYLFGELGSKAVAYGITYTLIGIPLFLAVLFLHSRSQFFDSLGLNRSLVWGMTVAFLCTLPMLIGYAVFFSWNGTVSWDDIFIGAVFAAFFEELYFRAFLFGQLFRYTRLGFFPAIIIGALVFASGHLYQSADLGTMVGIFFTTFLGAGLFAWTYVEWKNNLWVPIGLHFLMNLYWMLFSAGENAFGGLYANIFRILTIVLIIVGTIIYKKRKGLSLTVNRQTLWMKEDDLPIK